MKIAAQLFTVHDYLGTKEDMDMTFKKVKEMGYDYIQLSGAGYIDDEKAEYVKGLLEKYELIMCVTHMSFDQLDNELDSLLKYHKLWGCDYIGIGSMPKQFSRDEIGYKSFAEWANNIGDIVSQQGLTFVYHNHSFEFEKYNGKTGLEILAEGFNNHVQLLLDTYWVQAGGANPASYITKLADKIDIIHLKDYGIKNYEPYFAEIGSGNIDWQDVIKACNQAGVKYAAVERDKGETEPFESLAISRKYLKEVHGL